MAMRVAIKGTSLPMACLPNEEMLSEQDKSDVRELYVDKIKACTFGQHIGRDDITEDIIRQALFRYSLYMSYLYKGQGEAPQLWVLNPRCWAERK